MAEPLKEHVEEALAALKEYGEFPDIVREIAKYAKMREDYWLVSHYLFLAAEEADRKDKNV